MFAMLFTLMFTMPVLAADQPILQGIDQTLAIGQSYSEWDTQKDVSVNKVWSIKLNAPVLASTVNDQNVYVVDGSGQRQNVKVSLLDTKTIRVTPSENYKPGTTYSLYILKEVSSASQTALKNNIRMQFTTVASSVPTTYSSSQIFSMVSPSVVYIEVNDSSGKFLGSGSGFAVDTNGKIATNYHVIKGAYSAKVKTSDGKVFNVTKVFAYDAAQDMALIKVDTTSLKPVTLGDSDKVGTGDKIYTIGSPLGLDHTMSDGLISTKSRLINGIMAIQISAPISHGSSGGALVNEHAETIGITFAGIDEGQNLNFAIPINLLKPMLGQDINKTLPQLIAVSAPANVVATATSSSEITVTWNTVSGAEYYHVYKCTDGINYVQLINSDDGTKAFRGTSIITSGLQPNTTAYYKIKAVKNEVESNFSNVAYATTLSSTKFFPLLSDVPMPTGGTYLFPTFSSVGSSQYVFYNYNLTDNLSSFFTLLSSNGWTYYSTTKDDYGRSIFNYSKGTRMVSLGWVGTTKVYQVIFGIIH